MTNTEALPATLPSDAAQRDQRIFRIVLRALSYPGRIVPLPALPDAPLCPALSILLLGLIDQETGLWLSPSLDCGPVRSFLTYRASPRFVATPKEAAIAAIDDPAGLPALDHFHPGEPTCPESSTTVLLRVPSLTGGLAQTFRGPGIETTVVFSPQGLSTAFWDEWARNHERYPLGVDLIMTDGAALVGLPRTAGQG